MSFLSRIENVVKTTTDIELRGISIAATKGVKKLVAANANPIKLYINENTKLHFKIVTAYFENSK